MNLIGYVRVSTESQENNTSLDNQKKAIIDYCNLYNHKLLDIVEDIKSGANIEKRNLKTLLNRVNNNKEIDGIIIFKLDRLSRNLREALEEIELLNKNNKTLISISEQYDFSSSQGKLMLSMLLSFSEYERSIIKDRLLSGKKNIKEKKGYTGGAIKLGKKIGTKVIDNKEIKVLVDNDKEIEIIQIIKNHRRSGKSLYAIAKYLNDNGYKTKRGKSFTVNQIKGVLNAK